MTTQDLIEYYKNLLIIQYYGKSKARATVGAFCGALIADQVIQQVADGFDVASASGAQLDILGGYRGISRQIPGLDLNKVYLEMPAYGDAFIGSAKGFPVYAATNDQVSWFFTQYADAINPSFALSDQEMRSLIRFRARAQSSNLSLGNIDAILEEFFGNSVTVQDNGDMTITYNDPPSDTGTLFKICQNTKSLPKPAGVQVIVTNL